jgi:hypothetical protein
MRATASRLLWPVVCLALVGCGAVQVGTSTPGQARGTILATAGSYDGARLGMTTAQLESALGIHLAASDNPYYTPAQAPPFLPADNFGDWVYPDVGVTFVAGEVASMTIYGLGAATARGVGIGDPLARVSQTYGAARCEPAHGGVNPEVAGCQVVAARGVYLYFSGSPIKLIALSSYPFLQ